MFITLAYAKCKLYCCKVSKYCSVYMMKSELSSSREATDFARAARVVALNSFVRSDCVVILRTSLPRSTRHQNQRIFPYNYFFGGGVWGGADKKWKGKFFVLVSPLKV